MLLDITPEDMFNCEVCDEGDSKADSKMKNWDGRSVKKVRSRWLNKYRIIEYMDNLSFSDRELIFGYHFPRTYFVDIEVEVTDSFPEPSKAANPVTTICIVTPERQCIVLATKDLDNQTQTKIQKQIDEHFKDIDDDFSFTFKCFKSEYDMMSTFMMSFVQKFPMMTGWNFINYDWQYIVNRCKRLQIDLTQVAITGSLDKKDSRPLHMGILDYMQLYDKYDRSVAVKESNSLDFVSGAVLDVAKIKYTGGLQELYENNFQKYIYYNVVDSCLVYYIDEKLRSMEVLLTLATITRMPLYKAASPVAVTESLIARKLAADNKKIAVEWDRDTKKDTKYEGAFVKQPIVGYYSGVSAFDFASLYPSVMRQFNISPDSFVEMIPEMEVIQKRKEPGIIVCENGAVYKKEDSMLKLILSDLYGQRKEYKKTSYTYYEKAHELKKKFKV